MRIITLLLLATLMLASCKSTKEHCDAYSQTDIKKDHQI
jgi:uncharacterized protein YcfL